MTRDATLQEDVIPFETPTPDGLRANATGWSYALARFSPRRPRWPSVAVFDERVLELEKRQRDVNAEIDAVAMQLLDAKRADREALARWVATPGSERPAAAAPALEQRIADMTAERDALIRAVEHTLDEKVAFVEKHRGRLVREAAKARQRAVERLDEAITAAESLRAEAVACVAAEHWVDRFPGEEANSSSLRLAFSKGGRLTKALPELTSLVTAGQFFAALREDAAWLANVLSDEKRDEVDPHFEAIWEQSDEGRKAIALANSRIREGLKPRHVREAGWGE